MSAPDITFRSDAVPATVLTGLNFVQTKEHDAISLPVKEGELSDEIIFRIYNNYVLNASVSDAANVDVTTYDGVGGGTTELVVSNEWIRLQSVGFGQSTTLPVPLSVYEGIDTPVGGGEFLIPDLGSAGTTTPTIKGSSSYAGFIRIKARAEIPAGAAAATFAFVIAVEYTY